MSDTIGLFEKQDVLAPFYEFAMWNAIEVANAETKKHWSVSMCRQIRKQMMSEIIRQMRDAGIKETYANMKVSMLVNAVNHVLDEVAPGHSEYTRENVDADVKDFRAYLKGEMIPNEQVVPLSPYWNLLEGISSVNKAGTEPIFVSKGELDRMGLSLPEFMKHAKGKHPDLRFARVGLRNNFGTLTHVPMLTDDDTNKLTMLAKYMTEKEYNEASNHLKPVIGLKDFMPEKDIQKAIAILDYLQENGYEYSVRPERNGQLEAKITGTSISVRLTDTPENSPYIGRVYDDGAVLRFNTSYTKRDANGKIQPVQYTEATTEDMVNLLRFALGQPLVVEGERVGRAEEKSYNLRVGGQNKTFKRNRSYVTSSGAGNFVYKPFSEYKEQDVNIYRTAPKSATRLKLSSSIPAMTFLQDAVSSARANFKAQLREDEVYQAYREQLYTGIDKSEMLIPESLLDGDITLAEIRQSYWDVLTGKSDLLLKPGVTIDDYNARKESINAGLEDNFDDLVYTSEPEVAIQEHADAVVDKLVGSFTPDENGKRFDMVTVSEFMDSPEDVFNKRDALVSACQELGFTADEMRGDSFSHQLLGNQLVYFDVDSATPMKDKESAFMQRMYNAVKESLESRGCIVDENDILIDANGLVSYKAIQICKKTITDNGDYKREITGTMGQIFEPDAETGVVTTRFASSKNYLSAPGYEAYVIPQKLGENKSMEERTRLRGYAELMEASIRYEVSRTVSTGSVSAMQPTAFNKVYSRVYDSRHDLDYMEHAREENLSQEWVNRVLRMEASRVKYPKSFEEGSTIRAEYEATHGTTGFETNPRNDNFYSVFALTGGRNLGVLGHEVDGYFDPLATGGGTNQGIVRYLTEDVTINPDGSLTKGDVNSRAPLMADGLGMEYSRFDPSDRVQMVMSNLMQASSVTEAVVAQVTLGGCTFEDGVAVSKKWAEEHPVRGADGKMRPFQTGDKVCEGHGNKGVSPYVIDPDMDKYEAEVMGLTEHVKFFKNNPDVDMVMAPFPAVSRFNGGTAREMFDGKKYDLVLNDGSIVECGASTVRMMITHMTVDNKTKLYDSEALAQGRGRKASAQLAWGLDALDATAILTELYGSNHNALVDLREHLIILGLDIDEYGNLLTEYRPQEGENRAVFEPVPLQYTEKGSLSKSAMLREFKEQLQGKGGFMKIPFPLVLRGSGDDAVYTPQDENGNYVLPVLSAYLRSGHELLDGEVSTHTYTNTYLAVYEASLEYRDLQQKLENASASERSAIEAKMNELVSLASAKYATTREDIIARKFEGKHNLFREGLMANKQLSSATAVWTADTNIGVDELAMSSAMMKHLGVKQGDPVMIWRDPVLRGGGIRGFKATLREDLVGVAVNPAVVEAMSGDFDGDSVGVKALKTKEAKREVLEKLSVAGNLLDYAVKDEETGLYELNLHQGLDVQVARYYNPELDAHFKDIKQRINDYERNYKANGSLPEGVESVHEGREAFVKELNGMYKQAFHEATGKAVISYKDMESHLRSVCHACIETGAKGSMGKVRQYMRYLGVSDGKDEGEIDYEHLVDHHEPLVTRQDHINTQIATEVKAFGTGVAGMSSQRGMSALRNYNAYETLELTYVVTQSVLQAKHDPVEAKRKFDILMSTSRAMWQGIALEETVDADGSTRWTPLRENGKIVPLSREKWVEQTTRIYHHKDGLNIHINPELIENISHAMTDEQGYMMNLEKELKEACGSPMDKMAYGGKVSTLESLAKQGANIFDGKYTNYFKPEKVRANTAFQELEHAVDNAKLYKREADKSMLKHHSFIGRDSREGNKETIRASSAVKKMELKPETRDELEF